MKGMLAPKFREVELGRAEVRSVFKISSAGTIAGCYVLEGKVTRTAKVRLVRDGIVITEDEIDSLRRFKDDVKEVAQGYECGIGLDKFSDIKEGDIFEASSWRNTATEQNVPFERRHYAAEQNMARLSEDMKRELIAIIGG